MRTYQTILLSFILFGSIFAQQSVRMEKQVNLRVGVQGLNLNIELKGSLEKKMSMEKIKVIDIEETTQNEVEKCQKNKSKVNSKRLQQNLIANGQFENNNCKQNYCIGNELNVKLVNAWTPLPEIQIGQGRIYNSDLPQNNFVAQLDVNQNSCIQQEIKLSSGKYILEFDWAARKNTALESNGIQIYLNNQSLISLKPDNYKINHQSLQINVQNALQHNAIKFCATGVSDSYGSILDNVKLFKIGQNAQN